MFFQRFRRQGGLDDVQDAISAQRKAVELTQPSDINFGTRYTNLGAYLLARMQLTKSPNDIQDGISTLVHALSTIDTDDETDYYPLLHNLAASYMTSFEVSGDPEDLDACISNRQLCIQLTPPRHERLPFWMDVLGTALGRRFEITKSQSDIDEAIATFETALSITPLGHPFLPHLLYNLSMALVCRADYLGPTIPLSAADYDKAILHRHRAIRTARGRLDSEELANWIHSTALLLSRRFDRTNEETDIHAAIIGIQEAIDLLSSRSPPPPNLPIMYANLAASLYARYKSAGHITDLDDAIVTQKKSIELCSSPRDSQAVLGFLRLGLWFHERAEKFGEIRDFEEAIIHHKRVLAGTPPGHDDHAGNLSQLGNIFLTRFLRIGTRKDLEFAVAAHRGAVLAHASAPSSNEPISGLYSNLGNSLARRFEHSGAVANLDEAIEYQRKSTRVVSDALPILRATMFNNLGISLTMRFERTGAIGDVEEALEAHRMAAKLDSQEAGGRHETEVTKSRTHKLNNLCVTLLRRFERLGHMQDIEEAILIQREVVSLTHDDDPSLPTHLNNLARFLLAQYGRTNEIDNLGQAAVLQQSAVDLTPDDHRDLPAWLSNLGGTLLALSEAKSKNNHSASREEAERAIRILERASALFPESHPKLPSCLNNLSRAFHLRYQSTGDSVDLESGTEAIQRAISLSSSDDVQLPDLLLSLGCALESQAKVEGISASSHIDDAINAHRKAVSITPETHARLPVYLRALGASLEMKSSVIIDEVEHATLIEESLACFKRGALGYTGAPSARLTNAILWAVGSVIPVTAGLPLNFEKSLEAYETAIKLLPLAAGIDQTPERRHEVISPYSGLVSGAAAAAFACDRLDKALEWLEQGRCLVWNQLNGLRTPVDDLRTYDSDLADRVTMISTSLERLSSRSLSSVYDGRASTTAQDDAYQHVKLADEWTKIIDTVHAIPQFNDFLRPPSTSTLLQSLPQIGTVVVINIHGTRCDALALLPGASDLDDLLHIPLPEFTYTKSEQLVKRLKDDLFSSGVRERGLNSEPHILPSLDDERAARPRPGREPRKSDDVMREILAELWKFVVKPILDALAFSVCFTIQQNRTID
ncbi:hypothetical protein D9611_013755 [Ephemerocybe angulata]|uniref:CHAT domain-containing protein n=1 Tax=Ephemerocybe angulata TaxID=980116 RepID=A0A8H5F1P0_9AGAR|nr:hypothetical protein D9611_013755 [Tulosesus angulatus]